MNLDLYISSFLQKISTKDLEVYNEFSLQHELGLFLRNNLIDAKVQFERNVSFFGFQKNNFIKREIDISIFTDPCSPDVAIELKFPRNGQIPEQMFSFCKDIQFLEELKGCGLKHAYLLILSEDKGFYQGKNTDGIYGYFRNNRILTGTIQKPTGEKNQYHTIKGRYSVSWEDLHDSLKYTLIKIQ